jgi:hypothetical protein
MDAERFGDGIHGVVANAAVTFLHRESHIHHARGIVPALAANVLDACHYVFVHSHIHQSGDLFALTLQDPAKSDYGRVDMPITSLQKYKARFVPAIFYDSPARNATKSGCTPRPRQNLKLDGNRMKLGKSALFAGRISADSKRDGEKGDNPHLRLDY